MKNRYKRKYNDGGDLGNTGKFLLDTALAEWAPNAVKQSDYGNDKYGRTLGNIASVHEAFDSQSPISKNVSKYWVGTPGEGMTEEQKGLYNKVLPIAKTGSSIGELYTAKGLSSGMSKSTNSISTQSLNQGIDKGLQTDYSPYISQQAPQESINNNKVINRGYNGNPVTNQSTSPVYSKFGGRMKYNNGGNLKSSFNPNLASNDNDFKNWYNKNTIEGKNKIPFSENLDYDYYSYYKNNDYKNYQGGHFPDTYKRPTHETFSNESIYSTPENPGGSWNGEIFTPHKKELGGELTEYSGFKHNDQNPNNINEGIPLNNGNTVEDNETRIEDYIYSDTLKPKGKSYSYADASKKINNKYSKRVNDVLSDNQKKLELKQLENLQEKHRANIMNKTYKKLYGGKLNKMDWGGNIWDLNNQNSPQAPMVDNINMDENQNKGQPVTTYNPYNKNMEVKSYNGNPINTNQLKGNTFDYNSLYNLGNFVGGAYDIYRGLKGGANVNYDRVNPELVDYSKTRELGAKDIQTGYRDTKNALKGVNNPAAYLSLIGQQAGQRSKDIGDLYTKSIEAEQNANVGIKNQSKYFNAQTQRSEADARQLERDEASNTLQRGISSTGAALAGTGRDKQMTMSQEESKKYIGSAFFVPVGRNQYKDKRTGVIYNITE